jgi:hypothetical protein
MVLTMGLKINMRIVRFMAAVALSSTAVFANPSNCASSFPGTDLATLNSGSGCTQVDNVFSGFVVGGTNTVPGGITPDLTSVSMFATGTPPITDAIFDTPGTSGTNPATWSVPGDGTGGELDSTVSFVANLDPLKTTFGYVGLGLNVGINFTGSDNSGEALVVVTETYCVGASTTVGCSTGTQGSLTAVFLNGIELTTPTPAAFAPVSQMVAITDEIQIFNNSSDDLPTAVTSLDNQFDEFQTPEPASFVLMGSALALVGFLRARKS